MWVFDKISEIYENLGKLAYLELQTETKEVTKLRLISLSIILFFLFILVNLLFNGAIYSLILNNLGWILLLIVVLLIISVAYPFIADLYLRKIIEKEIKKYEDLSLAENFSITWKVLGKFYFLSFILSVILFVTIISLLSALFIKFPDFILSYFPNIDVGSLFSLGLIYKFSLAFLCIFFIIITFIYSFNRELEIRNRTPLKKGFIKFNYKIIFTLFGYVEVISNITNILPTIIFDFFKNKESNIYFISGKLKFAFLRERMSIGFEYEGNISNPDFWSAILQSKDTKLYREIETQTILIDFGDFNVLVNDNQTLLNKLTGKIEAHSKDAIMGRWKKFKKK
ncbi:hypothetical protein J4480_04145 [Candidatus Woesearchaeota archaeon]|nr:hypothetical protein [Candidatus Woesearchaeota archaeon]